MQSNSHTVGTDEVDSSQLEKRLAVLMQQQQRHKELLDTMENVRWKFVTAFGLGAGFALFKASAEDTAVNMNYLAIILVIVISTASLVAQIRIYSLVFSLWYRIRCIQKAEMQLMTRLYGEVDKSLQLAFEIPQVATTTHKIHHFMTVHMASCFVFCAFIGLGLSISFAESDWLGRLLWFFAPTGALAMGTWLITDWYTRILNRDINIEDIRLLTKA
jgi:hypothetical protein